MCRWVTSTIAKRRKAPQDLLDLPDLTEMLIVKNYNDTGNECKFIDLFKTGISTNDITSNFPILSMIVVNYQHGCQRKTQKLDDKAYWLIVKIYFPSVSATDKKCVETLYWTGLTELMRYNSFFLACANHIYPHWFHTGFMKRFCGRRLADCLTINDRDNLFR